MMCIASDKIRAKGKEKEKDNGSNGESGCSYKARRE